MKVLSSVLPAALLVAVASAFTVSPVHRHVGQSARAPQEQFRQEQPRTLHSAISSEDSPSGADGDKEEDWQKHLESQEIRFVREELISKYVEAGKTQDVAEREVDEFLRDPEQSRKYLEMREYAMKQADLLGPELYLQFFGYFILGLIGTVGPKYYNAYKVRWSLGCVVIPLYSWMG